MKQEIVIRYCPINCVNKKNCDEKFLSQFKSEEDVSCFLKDLHSQVLEQLLQGELDSHLGYLAHNLI